MATTTTTITKKTHYNIKHNMRWLEQHPASSGGLWGKVTLRWNTCILVEKFCESWMLRHILLVQSILWWPFPTISTLYCYSLVYGYLRLESRKFTETPHLDTLNWAQVTWHVVPITLFLAGLSRRCLSGHMHWCSCNQCTCSINHCREIIYYSDVIMSAMASQITGFSIVC